jgi:hypothetical protein
MGDLKGRDLKRFQPNRHPQQEDSSRQQRQTLAIDTARHCVGARLAV